jgi:hypothetical protein
MTHNPDQPLYQLSYESRGGVLRFRVSSDIDAQAVRFAYWQEIISIANTRGVRRLLVFDRKKGKPAAPEELKELAALMQPYVQNIDCIAVVEPTSKFLVNLEYGEIYAREYGINVRVFSTQAEAERWLHYGQPFTQ